MKQKLLCLFSGFFGLPIFSQNILNANGPGNTYEEINNFLAPGYNAIESPEQLPNGNHSAFGRHIDEIFDQESNKFVFRFLSHIHEDNDVSTTSNDRQRVEIKTFASSPDNMKATLGEIVTYKWRFKIPANFNPSNSFTHIHQIKAVGGDDANPIFTLTLRKKSSGIEKLELIHDEGSTSNAFELSNINLSTLKNTWIEVTETIFFNENGSITIEMKRINDNNILFYYENLNIKTIRPDNVFVRPKWGIYRKIKNSLGEILDDLKDEEIFFSDFSINENSLHINHFTSEQKILNFNVVDETLEFTNPINDEICIYNNSGIEIKKIISNSNKIDISELAKGVYYLKTKEGKGIRFIKI